MKAQADKTVSTKSKAVANTSSATHETGESEVLFEDKRSEAIAQKQLAEKADNSPQAARIAQMQAMANGASAEPVQRHESEGDEELPGEQPELLQRVEKEEAIPTQNAAGQKKDAKPANNTGLPDTVKSGIEGLSGLSTDDVKVHYNSPKPAQLQAHAFVQGTDIHMAPGQEKHLPHEAWHVVQQKQGRVQPTKQLKGKVNVNDDAGLEKEADLVGARAAVRVASKSIGSDRIDLQAESETVVQRLVVDEDGREVGGDEFKEILRARGYEGSRLEHALKVYEWLQDRTPKRIEVSGALEEIRQRDNRAVLPTIFTIDKASRYRAIMNKVDNNWETVKSHHKQAVKGEEEEPKIFPPDESADASMKSMLGYRAWVTIASDKTEKGVPPNENSSMMIAKGRVKARLAKRISELNQSIEALEGSGDREKQGRAKALRPDVPKDINDKKVLDWSDAGSEDLTSDIDLNIMGMGSEIGAREAYKAFRTDWGAESGQVFDVNFYARDWKPNKLEGGLQAVNNALKEGRGSKNVSKEDLHKGGTRFEGKGEKIHWETRFPERGKFQGGKAKVIPRVSGESGGEDLETVYAIARMMRDLPADAIESVKQTIDPDPAQWTAAESIVEEGETLARGGPDVDKHKNLAYAEATEEVERLRNDLLDARIKGKPDEIWKIEKELLAARLKASFLAPEAYVTEAAFIHGVINKQIQSTTFKKVGEKQHKANVLLTPKEVYRVVLENVGFAFQALPKIDNEETRQPGYEKLAKYIYRAANALKAPTEKSKESVSGRPVNATKPRLTEHDESHRVRLSKYAKVQILIKKENPEKAKEKLGSDDNPLATFGKDGIKNELIWLLKMGKLVSTGK